MNNIIKSNLINKNKSLSTFSKKISKILSSNPKFESMFLDFFRIVREIVRGNYKKNIQNIQKIENIKSIQNIQNITLSLKSDKKYIINKKTFIELCKESKLVRGMLYKNNNNYDKLNTIDLPEITKEIMKLIEKYLNDELSEDDFYDRTLFNPFNPVINLKRLIDLFVATNYLDMDLYNLPAKLFFKILKIIINNKSHKNNNKSQLKS